MTEVIVQLLEDIDATAFYGVNNINIRILKDLFPNVKFVARGRMIKLIGKDTEVENLVNIINILMRKVANTNKLTEDEIVDIIKGNEVKTIDDDNLIIHGVSGKSICARTPNQQLLFKKYADNDLLFAIGPAGSGKTYTAIALAVKALKNKEVKKLY